jgi:hypothetical protein
MTFGSTRFEVSQFAYNRESEWGVYNPMVEGAVDNEDIAAEHELAK